MVTCIEEPLFTPRKLRVVVIGAGFSGLTFAYKFKYEHKLQDVFDLAIYEKNGDIGGTWRENRYPGVGCDVPAHIYTFSFEPNPEWSAYYVGGEEIWNYMRATCSKYNLDEKVEFNSKIVETIWDDNEGKWNIKVQQNDTVIEDQADVIVNSTGFLNQWKWPDIKGLHDFEGEKLHTAHWDPSVDYSGKRVALIGNGSSAIQVLPQMQKTAGHITTFIRTPTWVISNFVSQLAGKDGANFKYTEEQKEEFRKNPEKLKAYRKDIEHNFNLYFFAFIKDSPSQAALRGLFENTMRERLNNDPFLCEKLIPNWHVGCRRPTPGDGYLEALQKDNVSIQFMGIDSITAKGIKTKDGAEEEFDIIVCATGFDVSFRPFHKLVGKNDATLDHWKDGPEAYFGICAPRIPNYFIYTGPNSPLGHGSIFVVIDATTEYVVRWLKKIATTGIKSVTVREDATKEYNEYTQEFLKRTVWTSGCRSWYKNGTIDGPVTAMYAGSVLHYKECLESFRVEDFNIEYKAGNRFGFMGNGFTTTDLKGEDLAYYIEK